MDEELEQMLDDIEKRQERASAWEREFIDSVQTQLRRGRSLTPKQLEIIDRIWEKVTDHG
jgi:hypothetical protein